MNVKEEFMNFLNKLERKYGKYAINNLMLYILLGNGIIFLLDGLTGGMATYFAAFNWSLVLSGQVWRLFTFVFIPSSNNIIFFIFVAFLYYSIGNTLENVWGTFKFNVYYITGALFTIIALIIIQLITGGSYSGTSYYLNLSLFLAYAALFPDVEFLLYMIIPIKVKYLAFLDVALLLFDFINGGISTKVLIVVSLLNFILFFWKYLTSKTTSTRTQKQFKQQKRVLKQGDPIKVAFHKCAVCGKTELTDPEAEFRYCSSCNGNYEYCMEHLHNHEHKQ